MRETGIQVLVPVPGRMSFGEGIRLPQVHKVEYVQLVLRYRLSLYFAGGTRLTNLQEPTFRGFRQK